MKLNKHFYAGAVRVFFILITVAFTLSIGTVHPVLADDPVLTITKSHVANFDQGGVGTYTITVENTSGAPVIGSVTVVDELPAGLTVHLTEGVPDWSGTGWVCDTTPNLNCTRSDGLDTGASFETITLVVDVAVDAAASEPENSLDNVAIVKLDTVEIDRYTDPTIITPALTITKSHVGNFDQGGTGTYTITVANTSGAPISGSVTVVEELPAGLTVHSTLGVPNWGGTGWLCNTTPNLNCTRSDGLLTGASFETITLVVDVAVDAAASEPENSLDNVAIVKLDTVEIDRYTNPTTITQLPSITITKSHVENFAQGGTGTYTILVTNNGGAAASGTVIVVDELPSGLTVHNTVDVPNWSGTGWVCAVAPDMTCTRSDGLAPGTSFEPITLVVDVAVNAAVSEPGNILDNVAIVELVGVEQDRHTDPTTITQKPDLTVTKIDADLGFVQMGVGTYTITASNIGYADTSGEIIVTDELPVGLTAKSISGPGWTCVLATVTCKRSDVRAPGALPDIILTVDVAVDALEIVENTVTVSGGGELNVSNNSGVDSTHITQMPDLIITNVVLDPPSPLPNEPFDVIITVKNQGGAGTGDLVETHVYVGDAGAPVPDLEDYIFEGEVSIDNQDILAGRDRDDRITMDPLLDDVTAYRIYAYADANELVTESNETNNAYGPVGIVKVDIGGVNQAEYFMAPGEERRLYYPVSGGPAIVKSLAGTKIVAAIRLQSMQSSTLYSFVETMGVPKELISDKYYFPTYNNTWAPLNSQVRFANLGTLPTDIRVTIGGTVMDTYYDVPANGEMRLYYNVSGGPVIVESLDGTKIVAAIRLQSMQSETLYSFAETMGVPKELVSDKYYFPTYNNTWAPLNSQVRFANLSTLPTDIRVTIGGTVMDTYYDVPANGEMRLYYNVSGGPVIVESLDGTDIIAAIRLQSMTPSGTLYNFVETMGVPKELVSDKYYFPTYNNTWAPLNSQVRFANLGTLPTDIRVTIGGTVIDTYYDVPVNGEMRLYYPVSGGPVIVESLDGTDIIAAIRLQSMQLDTLYSFAETMGVPKEILSSTYYFPTYNNTWAPLNSQLRFGIP